MRTNFTSAQLADPAIAEANDILQSCVHYGFCTNTCPTYVLTRDENDSPRGRIDLIRGMLERGGSPDAREVHHLDRCLSCLSCMTTCAVKVDYVHLIDRARSHIETAYRRPWADRMMRAMLAAVLPRPRLFLAALHLAALVRGLSGLLPARLRPMFAMMPDLHPDILVPQLFRAEGARRGRVALLAGCAQQALDGRINAATIRVLQRHGYDVVVADGAGCCGSLTLHMGRQAAAAAAARRNVGAWMREVRGAGLDAVIVNASGCGTTVKDYGHLLADDDDARTIAALARDVTEFLAGIGLRPAAAPALTVAYHDPCSMQHGQRVTRPPRDLLRSAGFKVVDVPEKHFCCGSAGTYNLLQPAMAEALGRRKAAHIDSTAAQVIATGNIGCMVQIGRYAGRPVVHTAELLDWATGGPCPAALVGIEPAPARTDATLHVPDADTGIW